MKLTDAIDGGLHIELGHQVHGDHRCGIDFAGATSGRVFAGYFGCLVEQVRYAELFIVSDEALKSDRCFVIAEQLDHRMSQTVLILDRTATSFRQISCSKEKKAVGLVVR